MLASGHFGNNQAGQLKVLLVLTSTDVIDKQESVTPLRPEEYPTPVKEEKKRRVKQEDTSPAPQRQKRVKHEDKSSSEGISGGTDPNGLVSAGVISSPKVPIYNGYRQDSMGAEREEIMEEIVYRLIEWSAIVRREVWYMMETTPTKMKMGKLPSPSS
ncbi:hypothetical protein CLIM01_15116 [Colletotrichum limetticola]|uniref:Uncharacterized protein n=1 Tax=Colletotrichum limetticola TaxID=1209924 RepID=A0ABQ9P8T9_9PEZI|nr:hypothetical protein CLIM01_15116 [Colletotrichum limetticola]